MAEQTAHEYTLPIVSNMAGKGVVTSTDVDYDPNNLNTSNLKEKSVGAALKQAEDDISNIKIALENTSTLKSVTYSELVSLRNEGGLIPGSKYRITDYITTTTQANTRSALWNFDVIVEATSENILSEDAKAIKCFNTDPKRCHGVKNSDIYDFNDKNTWYEYGHSYGGPTLPDNVLALKNEARIDTISTDYGEIDITDDNINLYKNSVFKVTLQGTTSRGKVVGFGATLIKNGVFQDMDFGVNRESYYLRLPADATTGKYVLRFYAAGSATLFNDGTAGARAESFDATSSYFDNNDLNAWEIKYRLDNDTSRFAWADTVNGKGVIYYMKDEYGNECSYDFKNIQFNISSYQYHPDYEYAYTFTDYDGNDLSLSANTRNNIIKKMTTSGSGLQSLNATVFVCSAIHNNSFEENSSNNLFWVSSYYYNNIGRAFQNNLIAAPTDSDRVPIHNNTIGSLFKSNKIASGFNRNNIGNTISECNFNSSFEFNRMGDNCNKLNFDYPVNHCKFGSYMKYCVFHSPEQYPPIVNEMKWCTFEGGIDGMQYLSCCQNVTFQQGLHPEAVNFEPSNIVLEDGRKFNEALIQAHTDHLYVYRVGDKYGVKKMSSPYLDLGSFDSEADGCSKAASPEIVGNPNINNIIFSVNGTDNKVVTIEQYSDGYAGAGQYWTTQYLNANGKKYSRKILYYITDGVVGVTNVQSWVKIIDTDVVADGPNSRASSRLYSNGEQVIVKSDLDSYAEISSVLNSTLPQQANDNAVLYGYIGTLKNIGLSSENDIEIKSIKFQIRNNREPQTHPEVYIRLLKKTDRDWAIIAQSNSSKTMGGRGEYMTFDDLYNVSGEKLRDTDIIAITFVQYKDDDRLACTQVEVRTIPVSGGISNGLSYNTTSGASFSPAFEFGYIELQNVNVSAENISFDNSKIQINSSTVQNAITELRGYVGDNAQNIQKITYQELLDLKIKDSLIPGKKYRITDYDTTVDPGYSSTITVVQNKYKNDIESNRFDVIVEAINSHDLSENAQVSHCHTSLYNDANSVIYEVIDHVNRSKWNSNSWITNENDVVRRVPDVLKNKYKGQSIRVGILTRTIDPNTNFRIQAKPHVEAQSHDKILHIIGMDFVDQTTGEIYSADYGEVEIFSDTPVVFAHLLQPNITQPTTIVYRIFVLDDPEIKETAGDAQVSLETYVPYFRYNELYSWKIKYCLSNDVSRFAWADETNGKGVIYYMKDEFDNEASYDFKNILINGKYTFNYTIDGKYYDGSTNINSRYCYGNSISPLYNSSGALEINLIQFSNDAWTDKCHSNKFIEGCSGLTFSKGCFGFNFLEKKESANYTSSSTKIVGVTGGTASIGTATTAKVEDPKLGGIIVGTGFNYDSYHGVLSLGTAHNSYEVSSTALGGIIVGTGFDYDSHTGILNLGSATTTSIGGVMVGKGLRGDDGVLNLGSATTTSMGGVKIGEGIAVDNGTISIPKKEISINPKTADKYAFSSPSYVSTHSLDLSANYIIANKLGFDSSIIYLDATMLDKYGKTNQYTECKILWDDTDGVELSIGTGGLYTNFNNDASLRNSATEVSNDMVYNNIYIPEGITKANTAGSKIEITIRSYGQLSKSSKTYNNYPNYGSTDYIVGTGGLTHKHYITWQKLGKSRVN